MCYLILMTSPLNLDLYKHQFCLFELVIHIVTCIYIELIGNINIPNIVELRWYVGHI